MSKGRAIRNGEGQGFMLIPAHLRTSPENISEIFFPALMRAIPDLVWFKDPNGIYLACNRKFEQFAGATEAEIVGKTDYDLIPASQADAFRDNDRWTIAADKSRITEEWLSFAADGYRGLFEIITSPIRNAADAVVGVLGIAHDISDRSACEAKILQSRQIYLALGDCHSAIVSSASAEELFSKVCRSIVALGSIKMAWVGLADDAGEVVRPVAASWQGIEYLEEIRISVNDGSPYSVGPTGTSIRENRPVWCQDFLNDPSTAPWHERGAHLGWRASAALPLVRNGKAIGALTLYATETQAFDEAMQDLLIAMANDMSNALDKLACQ